MFSPEHFILTEEIIKKIHIPPNIVLLKALYFYVSNMCRWFGFMFNFNAWFREGREIYIAIYLSTMI